MELEQILLIIEQLRWYLWVIMLVSFLAVLFDQNSFDKKALGGKWQHDMKTKIVFAIIFFVAAIPVIFTFVYWCAVVKF